MSDRTQIESDEALARRMQQEELRGGLSFGDLDNVMADARADSTHTQRNTDPPVNPADNLFQALQGLDTNAQRFMQQHQQVHRQQHQQHLREHHQRHQQNVQQQQQQQQAQGQGIQYQQAYPQPGAQPQNTAQTPLGVPFARGGAEFTTDNMINELFRSIAEPSAGLRTALAGLEAAVPGSFPGRAYTVGAGGDAMPAPREGTRNAPAPGAGGARRDRARATGGANTGMPGVFGSIFEMLSNASGATGGIAEASFSVGQGDTFRFETTVAGGGGGVETATMGGTGGMGGATRGAGGSRNQDAGMGAGQGNPAADMLNMLLSGMRGGNVEGDLGDMLRSVFGGMGQGGETYEDLLELMERMGGNVNRGASEDEISNLPTQQFRKASEAAPAGAAGPSSSSAGAAAGAAAGSSDGAQAPNEKEKCAICLAEYEEGEELKELPCSHRFHSECINRWLAVNRICPLCTQSIRPADR